MLDGRVVVDTFVSMNKGPQIKPRGLRIGTWPLFQYVEQEIHTSHSLQGRDWSEPETMIGI